MNGQLQHGFAPDAPVGVFDSGVGGLTVLRDLLRELPAERYIFFGDTGTAPMACARRPRSPSFRSMARRFCWSGRQADRGGV